MQAIWDSLQQYFDADIILREGGFYVLLIVVFAETGLFFGFFLPGDYLLFLAGLFCATEKLDVSIVTLTTGLIAASVSGNFVGYWFGYRTGGMLFKRDDSFLFKKKYVFMAEQFYHKYGGMAIVLGRFLPIIRTFAPIFAGVVKVDLKKFTFYNILGGVLWVLTLTLIGYFLGKRYKSEIEEYLQYIILGFILITAVPLIITFFRNRFSGPGIDEKNKK